MKYTDRINNKEDQDQKAIERLGKKSKLQADADLLEVESQIEDAESNLDKLRLAESNYSLTKVGEELLKISDLKAVHKLMKAEHKAEF